MERKTESAMTGLLADFAIARAAGIHAARKIAGKPHAGNGQLASRLAFAAGFPKTHCAHQAFRNGYLQEVKKIQDSKK